MNFLVVLKVYASWNIPGNKSHDIFGYYGLVGYFPKIYFLLECEPSIEGAVKPLKIACEGNVASACHLLSLVYYNTKGVKAASDVEKYMRR